MWRCALAAEDLAERLVKAESKAAQAKLLTEEKELAEEHFGQAISSQHINERNLSADTRLRESA